MSTASTTAAVPASRAATIPLALSGLAAGVAVAGTAFALAGLEAGIGTVGGLQLAARHTARLSFALFLAAYCAGPLWRLTRSGWARWMMRERRGLGLAFAGAHFVHLAALLAFLRASGESAGVQTLVVGGGGYLLLAVMAATSNDASVRLLGAVRWRRLHAFCLHWLWFVFAATYALRIAAGGDGGEAGAAQPSGAAVYVVLLALAVAALGLRLAARYRASAPATPSIASSSSATAAERRRLLTR